MAERSEAIGSPLSASETFVGGSTREWGGVTMAERSEAIGSPLSVSETFVGCTPAANGEE